MSRPGHAAAVHATGAIHGLRVLGEVREVREVREVSEEHSSPAVEAAGDAARPPAESGHMWAHVGLSP